VDSLLCQGSFNSFLACIGESQSNNTTQPLLGKHRKNPRTDSLSIDPESCFVGIGEYWVGCFEKRGQLLNNQHTVSATGENDIDIDNE